MPRKTGTVTGASLDNPNRGKKGGLTRSKRVTGEDVDVETSFVPATTLVSDTPAIPTVLPKSDSDVATADSNARSNLASHFVPATTHQQPNQLGQGIKTVIGVASAAIQQGVANPSSITDGTVNTAAILAKADANIDGSVPELESGDAIKRNIIIARQRNYVGVAINNTKLKQDLATLDLEQQRLIGLLIDGKTARIDNEKKAVTYHRAVVGRDTELSKFEQDTELLTQQRIRTKGTQTQTELITEQEQLKVDKLREQNEKTKYEIQNIAYDKEKIKQEAVAKFAAGF